MMMPANFTAVNSEVVYGGADLFSILADTTAPIWNAANVKTFNTNLLTILSNTFTSKLVGNTLGVMFGGSWGDDNVSDKTKTNIFGEGGALDKNVYTVAGGSDMTFGNKVMQVLGMASVAYTLGTTDAKVGFNDAVYGINGKL
mgnify:CR=1 FL=1